MAEARRRLTDGVGGVGAFIGLEGGGFVELFKGSDYGPFVRDLVRTREEELVLIGTAALYSVQTLWHVVTARSAGLLPTGGSQVYNAEAPDEDAELALDADLPGLQSRRRSVRQFDRGLCRVPH